MPGMAKKTQSAPKSFEEAIQELEKILGEIESGNVGLEESLVKYERGTFLVQHCRSVLAQAEKQIEQITKSSEGVLNAQEIPASLPAPTNPTTTGTQEQEL